MKSGDESLVSCLREIFLSIALCKMGCQAPRPLSPKVCQIWLDQRRLRYAQVFQLPGFPLCITSISFRLWEMWATTNGKSQCLMSLQQVPPPKKKCLFVSDLLDESRIAEISKQLQAQHEKFCPWPDFPCPGRNKKENICLYIYIFTLVFKCMTVIVNWYYFREVLAHSFQWTISTFDSLSSTFQEHLSSGTAAASTKVRPAEVYGAALEEWLPFWIPKQSL